MRKFIIILFAVCFFPFGFVYSQTNTFKLGFTGAYPLNWNQDSYNYTDNSVEWSWYSELNMNLWSGWQIDGRYTDVLNHLARQDLYCYFQPDTMIYHASYGRISLFEAEADYKGRHRYAQHYNMGKSVTDEWMNEDVSAQYYHSTGTFYNPPASVLSVIDENKEQVLSGIPTQKVSGDAGLLWYVKPRMRIKTGDALVFPPKNVAKVIIKAYNGNPIKEYIITTKHFRYRDSSTYDGRYLEEYWQMPLTVTGDELRTGADNPNSTGSAVDYEICWYGTVDLWIDYVKVMDKTANDLMNPNDDRIRQAIIREMKQLLSFRNLAGFYTEEVQYSNLRCLKFIQNLLQVNSNNDPRAKLVCLINPPTYIYALKNPDLVNDYAAFMDSVGPQAFVFGAYPLGVNPLFPPPLLPNTLPAFTFDASTPNSVRVPVEKYYGSLERNPAEYNTNLQNIYSIYINELKKYGNICSARSKALYVNTGPVANYDKVTHWVREPMNSEFEALHAIALCYGVMGFVEYAFESWHSPESATNGSFNYGMLDGYVNGQLLMSQKRTLNFYNENKWDYVKNLFAKIKTWGPVLVNSTSTSGFSVAIEGANHEYINDIQSAYKTLPEGSVQSDWTRYWEMGFFTTNESNTKYFMMVNRRCVPGSDLRWLGIKFNADVLNASRYWKITDVYTGQDTTFDVLNQGAQGFLRLPAAMKTFQPGEGKLFKLIPVP